MVFPLQTVLRVALPVPLPRLFDYLPPDGPEPDASWIGRRLRVPFGRGEKIGLVAEVGPSSADAPELRQALQLLDSEPLLHGELLETLRFCARYYHAPLGEVLASAVPVALRDGQPPPETAAHAWRLSEAGQAALGSLRGHGKPRRLLEKLRAGGISEDSLERDFEGWRVAVRSLHKRGLIERIVVTASDVPALEQAGPALNSAQAASLQTLRDGHGFRALLLEGVTGSGKTEVYLQAIRDCLAAGKQALILVPEIGLTPQTLQRFRSRLGVPVLALHSGLASTAMALVPFAFLRAPALRAHIRASRRCGRPRRWRRASRLRFHRRLRGSRRRASDTSRQIRAPRDRRGRRATGHSRTAPTTRTRQHRRTLL